MPNYEGILDGMDQPPLEVYATQLANVTEIYSVLVDPRTAPGLTSPAARELQAAREQPGQSGLWGEEPIREAYALATMKYQVALEHARAMAALMTSAYTAIPAIVLARALVEVAGHAWWLLEPEIGHVKRACRLQVLRHQNAVHGQRSAEADGVPDDDYRTYTETVAQVAATSEALALAIPQWSGSDRTYICDSEKLPSATTLIRNMFSRVDVPSVYNLFSGYSHGQLFALWREFELVQLSELTIRYQPAINVESFKAAVAVASYALDPPADRMRTLFGFDEGPAEEPDVDNG